MLFIFNGFALLQFICVFITSVGIGYLLDTYTSVQKEMAWGLVVSLALACAGDLIWRLKFATAPDDDRLFASRAGGSLFFLPAWPVWGALALIVRVLME